MLNFTSIHNRNEIYLYAGDLSDELLMQGKQNKFVGLSIEKEDDHHISFDITNKFPLNENSVDVFCAEDVMEHIEYEKQIDIFNEIYRILKPNGIFRLAVPDYRCDILFDRSIKNKKGELVFDPGGGGRYSKIKRKVLDGGHVWFPKYENVYEIFKKSNFEDLKVDFLHGYIDDTNFILQDIDYSICYIKRTPDDDPRVKNPRRPMSIVVDVKK